MTKINGVSGLNAAAVLGSMVSLAGNKLAVDLKAIDKGVKWIADNGKASDAIQHATACAAIAASLPFDQGGHMCPLRAERMLNGMPKGSRAKALAAWFEHFSNLRPKLDKDSKRWTVGILKATAPHYKLDVDRQAAFDKPFYTVDEVATNPAAFDMGKLLHMVLVKASKAAEKGTLSATDAATVAELTKLAQPYAKAA